MTKRIIRLEEGPWPGWAMAPLPSFRDHGLPIMVQDDKFSFICIPMTVFSVYEKKATENNVNLVPPE